MSSLGQTAIEVRGVSKRYKLGSVSANTFKKDLLSRVLSNKKTELESDMMALDDISFTVNAGEVFGIIGRNGAGKSTLLKIMSKITAPSSGTIKLMGRMASLLEVGTGFHPELTGKENIFLNGAILGMTRSEIKAKFDEIVDFSGVEKFLDTPVKRYSSGMYVRLAFGVAAHLDPDILVVDEVLAVGDVEFQKKCLDKMDAVASGEGRTILLVTHNMRALTSICQKAMVLEHGRLSFIGSAPEAVSVYEKRNAASPTSRLEDCVLPGIFKVLELNVSNELQPTLASEVILDNAPLHLTVLFELNHPEPERFTLMFHLNDAEGVPIFSFSPTYFDTMTFLSGRQKLACTIPAEFLNAGTFRLKLLLMRNEISPQLSVDDALIFDVLPGGRPVGKNDIAQPGHVRPRLEWKLTPATDAE